MLQQLLVVLDNCEHVIGAAAGLCAGLLSACDDVRVLATSREPLRVAGEDRYRLAPLTLPGPDDPADAGGCEAVALFADRARSAGVRVALDGETGPAVARLVTRLDGMPLAIELAAARVEALGVTQLLDRLDDRFALLTAGDRLAPGRQRSLAATVAWSYQLLDDQERRVFRAVSVFPGPFTLEAAEAVAGDGAGPAVLRLVDCSLLVPPRAGPDGRFRYGILETIREYALECLGQTGELDAAQRRHARYYAAFAEQAHGQLLGPAHLASLDRLEAEHDNLRAALGWSLDTSAAVPAGDGEQVVIGLRLVQALRPFWSQHGHVTEGRRWLEQAIALVSDDAGAPLAKVAHELGTLLMHQCELDAALRLLGRSLAIWRDLGDREQQSSDLNNLGIAHHQLGDLDTARSLLEDSVAIARELGGGFGLRAALTNLGQVEAEAGNFDRATQLLHEALALDRELDDLWGIALNQGSLAQVSLRAGRAGEARDLLSATFEYVVSSGDAELLAETLETLACIAADLGEGLRAARLAGAAETIRQNAGTPAQRPDAALLERFLAPARAAIAPEEWHAELAAGRALTQQQAATLLVSPISST